MLPLLPWIIALLVAILGIGYTVYRILKEESFYIGPIASGKSTLVGFLKDGKIVKEYQPTNAPIKYDSMLDLGGDESVFYNHLEKLVKGDEYKYAVYIFSTEDYLKNDIAALERNMRYQKLVEIHLRNLRTLNKSNKKVIIVGTHTDKISNEKENIQKIRKDLTNSIDTNLSRIVFGSLKDKDNAKLLLKEIEVALNDLKKI